MPKSAVVACALSIGNKVLHQIIETKHKIYGKQYEKDQQKNKPFGEIYSRSLQENLIVKNGYDS